MEGAIFSEEGETITVDVTKAAFTLHAGDTLAMTLDRLGGSKPMTERTDDA